MLKIGIILSAYTISVLSSGLESKNYVPDRVFDYDLLENVLDPSLCQKHLRDMRPFEFYDASFRVPQSILKGNFASLGNFHQCLAINQYVEGDVIQGKYCMMRTNPQDSMTFPLLTGTSWLKDINWVEPNTDSTKAILDAYEKFRTEKERLNQRIEGIAILNTFSYSLAICIPKTCSLAEALAPINNSIINFTYEEQFCRLPGDKPLVAADYTAIAIFSIIGCLTILSTSYDIWYRFMSDEDPGKPKEIFQCYSVLTNTERLVTFRSIPGAIDCLDGIRVLSIMWVIIGHTFLAFLTQYSANLFDFFEWYDQRRVIWLRSSELSVDTFFVLSGLLLVYSSVRKMKQMQLVKNLHLFYLYRLLRMLPLLACAVLLQASIFNQVSDGANWHYMAGHVQICREYWWSALLHIQNIVNPTSTCLPQTWYLSVDIQLHILSPLVLFWVLGSYKSAWNGLTVGLITSWIATTVFCFLRDFSGPNYSVYYYTNTLTRAPPFFIGMVFGYVLHMHRERKVRLSVWFVTLGYMAASVVSLYCMYTFYDEWDIEVVSKLNLSFMRSCWVLCVCWVIFACVHGYGGPINWFLSLTIFKFMGRISYAMYLFHYSILFTISGATTGLFYFSLENIFQMYASVMVYTVILSIAAYVLIDAPCSTLQKLLLNALTPSVKSTTVQSNETASPQNASADDKP